VPLKNFLLATIGGRTNQGQFAALAVQNIFAAVKKFPALYFPAIDGKKSCIFAGIMPTRLNCL
jgi:hypothetical protein